MVSAEFTKAADQVKTLKKDPSNDEKLELYALFKIAKGENVEAGGVFNPTQKYKHSAWQKKKDTGISASDAEAEYVKYVGQLVEKYGTN